MKAIVFATTNPAKVLQIQGALKDMEVVIAGLPDSAKLDVIEDGQTAQDNARKKAAAYAEKLGKPVLSMDNALFLDGLPSEKQPGVHVRRIGGTQDRPSDEKLIEYYSALVDSLGGRIAGRWEFALCYAKPDGTTVEDTIVSPRVFVSTPSVSVVPGYPLESIQIDPESGMYISEMSQDEQDNFWQRSIGKNLATFIKSLD